MKNPTIRSFGFRLSVVYIGCLLLVSVGFAWYHTKDQDIASHAMLQRQTLATAQLLSVSLGPLIQEKLITEIETHLLSFTSFQDIQSITVVSKQGLIISEVQRDPEGKLFPSFRFGTDVVKQNDICDIPGIALCWREINYANETVGWAGITIDYSYVETALAQVWRDTFAKAALILALASLIIWPAIRKNTRSLIRAAHFAREIPNRPGEVLQLQNSSWELEHLTQSLNTASHLIKQHQDLLASQNKLLLARVQELDCNYKISAILNEPNQDLGSKLQAVTYLLAAGLSDPNANVSIDTYNSVYQSSEVQRCKHKYSRDIKSGHDHFGSIRIGSTENKLDLNPEDIKLVEEIALKVGLSMKQHKFKQELLNTNARLEQRVSERTEQLQQAKDKAEQASQVKSAFLSNMSHELRTPLNAVLGFAQLLESKFYDNVEEHKDYVQQILISGNHLMELVTNTLELANMEQGSNRIHKELTNLNEVIDEAVDIIKPLCADKNVQLYINCLEEISIYTDRSKVFRALINLLSNAVKFNKQDGKVDLLLSRNYEGKVVISISDTGTGIAENTIPDLFNPFEKNSDLRELSGTGIGLTITKHMVELLQGRVEVNSSPGEGSEFKIYLDNLAA